MNLRVASSLVLVVTLGSTGCSAGSSPEPPAAPSSRAQTGPAIGVQPDVSGGAVYTGPDEFSVRAALMPIMSAQQRATEAAFGKVDWLSEPAFLYRRSMNDSSVPSLHVTGTTSASTTRSESWLKASNEALSGHGFQPVSAPLEDDGGGLLLISANPALDACLTTRWGQGSVTITIEVAATDWQCT